MHLLFAILKRYSHQTNTLKWYQTRIHMVWIQLFTGVFFLFGLFWMTNGDMNHTVCNWFLRLSNSSNKYTGKFSISKSVWRELNIHSSVSHLFQWISNQPKRSHKLATFNFHNRVEPYLHGHPNFQTYWKWVALKERFHCTSKYSWITMLRDTFKFTAVELSWC